MNKAFNFIETVLALLVGLVILAGLLRFVNVGTSQYLEAKKQLQWEANASMARTALRSRFRQLDPQFWANFPAMRDPIHGAFTFFGPGSSVSTDCVLRNQTCLTLWDCEPAECPVPLIVNDVAYPQWLEVIPLDENEPAPEPRIGAQVGLIVQEENVFAFLIRAIEGNRIYLADVQSQLWDLPEIEDWAGIELYILGPFLVDHFFLRKSPGRGNALVSESWLVNENGWYPKRGFASFTHFSQCVFESDPPVYVIKMDSLSQEGVVFDVRIPL
ncbi:MAG: hypothetical protein H6510_14400 [Acidobacteria bacterium]|nr:hypothetical protein [Acidobacteriota bacterium]MCB9399001.1 hypothetical protein [Acidobacteriota bacterium]